MRNPAIQLHSFIMRSIFFALLMFILLFACKKSNGPTPVPPAALPSITSISPSSGPKNTTVVITGTNFGTNAAVVKVSFNGVDASVQSVTATQISATVPAGAGTGKVAVSVNANIADGPIFTYQRSVTVSTLAGNGTQGYADGTGTAAIFNYPLGIGCDSSGNLYVVDQGLTVRKITSAGVVTTLAGAYGVSGHVDASGSAARFTGPNGICYDPSSNSLYIGETNHNCIRKVTLAGVVTTYATSATQDYADGPLASAKFYGPAYTAADGQGNIIFSEGDFRLRKISSSGIVSTIAGNGVDGIASGSLTAACINSPLGIATDHSGNIFLTEDFFSCIRKISAGAIATLAGPSGPNSGDGFADGTGAAAQFSEPFSLVCDNSGNIYTADRNNNCIRMITPAGVVTTIAGIGTAGNGFADGDGSVARFSNPTGITIDNQGNLYVADQRNHRVRKITFN